MRKTSLFAAIIAGLTGVGAMFNGVPGMARPKYPVPERPVYKSVNGATRDRSAPAWVQMEKIEAAEQKRARRAERNLRLMGAA